jgi:hypothetical protein
VHIPKGRRLFTLSALMVRFPYRDSNSNVFYSP